MNDIFNEKHVQIYLDVYLYANTGSLGSEFLEC